MTTERGPLPPLPVHPDARLYSDQVPFYSERTLVAMRQAAFDAGYAAAEVARLAGQAVAPEIVAWQAREWTTGGWTGWCAVSRSPDEYRAERNRHAPKAMKLEFRALGVIATPSAPIHWYCRKCGWVGIPSDSTP